MYYLEKISTFSEFGYSKYLYAPGIIDTFIAEDKSILATQDVLLANTKNTYERVLIDALADHNICIATKFGEHGIDIHDLILSDYDHSNVIFEIGMYEYTSLPRILQFKLSKFNLLVHDYLECGVPLYHPELFDLYKENSSNILNKPNIVFSSDNPESRWCIPMYMYKTVSDTIDSVISPDDVTEKNNSVLLPIRKPRDHRVDLLAGLDSQGLLDNCDWSLRGKYKQGIRNNKQMIAGMINPGDHENVEFYFEHDFMRKYDSILPKELPMGDKYTGIASDIHWRYDLYISSETYFTVPFVSEKSYKGFLSGLPTVIHGHPACTTYLQNLGFHVYDVDPEDQITGICELVKNCKPNKEAALHNFNLITNHTQMISILSNKVAEMFEYFRK